MNGKIVSLPIDSISFSDNDINEELRKVTLKVCKEGLVPSHNLILTKDGIQNAMNNESIINKPLLCAYEVDKDGEKTDFKGHEMSYKLVKGGKFYELVVVYEEQPVGVIPESCNQRFETIDGEEWFVVDGYLYNVYCNDAVRILEESNGEKSVSMEIKVIDSNENDNGVTEITNFSFKGVTLLGENNPPAIKGANITNFSQSDTFALKFEELIQRVTKLERKGGDRVNKEDILKKFEHLKSNEKFEEIANNTDLSLEDLEKELFSLSLNDLENKIRESLREITYSYTDWWGDTYELQKYWLIDVLSDENICIVEDNENYYKTFGIPYTISGDGVSLNIDEAKRYIRGDWRVYEEGNNEHEVNPIFEEINKHAVDKVKSATNNFEEVKLELDKTKIEFTDLQTEKSNLELELNDLREFKTNFERKEKEDEVNEIIDTFSELKGVEGFDDLIDKKFEMETEDLINKLKILAFDNGITISKKDKNFSKNSNIIKTNINRHDDELSEAEKRYGVDIKKYIK